MFGHVYKQTVFGGGQVDDGLVAGDGGTQDINGQVADEEQLGFER